MAERQIKSGTSHARIVYWHYKFQSFPFATNQRRRSSLNNILAVDKGFIEAEIESVETGKTIRNPSGEFDITLLPSRNWKQVIAPGDWLVIYLYDHVEDKFNYQNKDIAMLCNVDRVARVKQKDEQTDKTIVRYHVSGRDFGKVLEETDVFFSPYYALFENSDTISTVLTTRGLAINGSPSTLVKNLVDVFLSGNGAILDNPALGAPVTATLNQWKIPDGVAQLFYGGANNFHSILDQSIEDLPGYKPRVVLSTGDNGGLWGLLDRSANRIANNMYCDLSGRSKLIGGAVRPTIFLKSIPTSPFFIDTPGTLEGTSKSLIEKANEEGAIEVTSDEILFENMGRDGNYRFNMIWMTPKFSEKSAAVSVFSNVGDPIGIGLPMQNSESIQRHGLKIQRKDVDFVYQQDSKKNTSLNINMYKSFINLAYDLNAYHHCYETGTIEVNGRIDAELGRVLRVRSSESKHVSSELAVSPAKLYFIEGYNHSWKFPGRWTTEFTVTMGQWESVTPFIDLAPDDYGLFDQEFDSTSLVKTSVVRPGNSIPEDNRVTLDALDAFKGLV